MLAGYDKRFISAQMTAGSVTSGTSILPILRAPLGGITVTGAWAGCNADIAANGSNYLTCTLINAGTAGTATATTLGTAGGTAGFTAAPQALSLTTANVELTSGQYLNWKLGKVGSVAEKDFTIVVEYVLGKGD